MTKLEQAEQEPVAKPIGKEGRELWFKEVIDTTNAVLRETNEVEQIVNQERIEEHRALTSRNNAVVKESLTVQWQAEQEPVAWMEDSIELYVSEKPSSTYTIPLYAAPVRTKDLTDDEIRAIRFNWERNEFAIDFARAVISADREKNK